MTKHNSVRIWDKEYKKCVMSWMIVMLADMKQTQIKMEELLSLGEENPFDITQDRVATVAIWEVDKKEAH